MRRAAVAVGLVLAVALCAAAAPARAEDRSTGSYVGGLKLVWGSVPLPQFGTGLAHGSGFAGPPDAPSAAGYSVTLSTQDEGPQQFLFSPRMPQLLPDSTSAVGPNRRAYLGFSIDVGAPTIGLFGTFGLGGSVPANRQTSFEDMAGPRALNAPLLLHGGFELGYRADAQNTFTLSIDRALPAEGPDRTDTLSGVRLRYGLKF